MSSPTTTTVATHGYGGRQRWALGSVAGEVLALAPLRVPIAPASHHEHEHGRDAAP